MSVGAELYERARREGVVVRDTGRGLVRITGPQRVWFLQNTITADVDDVPAGRWVWSCFLDPKGHVLAHFRVGTGDDDIVLDVDPPATDGLADWFTTYRFRTKVEIADESSRSAAVIGPAAAALAGPGELVHLGGALIFGDVLGDVPVVVVHGDLPPAAAGLPEAPHSLYEIVRIEAGTGRFGVDYGPANLPQEGGLTGELSVTKGCYVGQEVVARLHFRGHVNKVVRPLSFENAGDPSTLPGRGLLAGGRKVGTVTSATTSPRRGPIGVGMVATTLKAGTSLSVDGGGDGVLGPVPAGTKVKTS